MYITWVVVVYMGLMGFVGVCRVLQGVDRGLFWRFKVVSMGLTGVYIYLHM